MPLSDHLMVVILSVSLPDGDPVPFKGKWSSRSPLPGSTLIGGKVEQFEAVA